MIQLKVAAFAIAFCLASFGAKAVTVTSSSALPAPITDPGVLPDPAVISGIVRVDYSGSDLDMTFPNSLSPYWGTPFENVALYHSVSGGAEARYLFDRPQNMFSMVHGSPDEHNLVSFWLGGTEVFAYTGDALVPPGTLGLSAVSVTISDILFDEVRFVSGRDALEFTNVLSTVIPLPATIFMLLGALGGLGVVTRRRATA